MACLLDATWFQTIRLLGLLGALDPHKEKVYSGGIATESNSTGLALSLPDGSKDAKDSRQGMVLQRWGSEF